MKNINKINLVSLSLIVVVLISAHQDLNAMPPHPDLETQIRSGKISLPDYLINPRYLEETGINQPSFHPINKTYPTGIGPTGSFKALVLLVNFSDNPSTVNPSFFDTLVFENQQGCVRHYYSVPNPDWNGAEIIWFKAYDPGGLCDSNEAAFTVTASGVEEQTDADLLPHSYLLKQNYPNPFNPETKIEYNLKEDGGVKLEVFNILGQKIFTLVDGYKEKGEYVVTWNDTDGKGKPFPSGIYFYQITTDNFQKANKMILLK